MAKPGYPGQYFHTTKANRKAQFFNPLKHLPGITQHIPPGSFEPGFVILDHKHDKNGFRLPDPNFGPS